MTPFVWRVSWVRYPWVFKKMLSAASTTMIYSNQTDEGHFVDIEMNPKMLNSLINIKTRPAHYGDSRETAPQYETPAWDSNTAPRTESMWWESPDVLVSRNVWTEAATADLASMRSKSCVETSRTECLSQLSNLPPQTQTMCSQES